MNCDRSFNVQAMLDRFSPFWAAGKVKISGGAAKATPHPGSHSPRPIIFRSQFEMPTGHELVFFWKCFIESIDPLASRMIY
jgi:hypothetical protein